MTKTTTLRLRRVRFKDGRTLDVLRPKPTDDAFLRRNFRSIADYVLRSKTHPMKGYAIVVWDQSSMSISEIQSDGTIPKALVPDFVRNRLLGDVIEGWTIDTINGDRP